MGTSTNIIIGAATVTVNGSDVGYTMGGTTIRYEPEVRDIFADQELGVVRKSRTAERMYVVTTLLEITLSQLRMAFMIPHAQLSGSTHLTLGYSDACWVEESLLVLSGKSPGCGTRTFTFNKVTTLNSKEYNMTREEETAFEVEFECLKSGGSFGNIVDS